MGPFVIILAQRLATTRQDVTLMEHVFPVSRLTGGKTVKRSVAVTATRHAIAVFVFRDAIGLPVTVTIVRSATLEMSAK